MTTTKPFEHYHSSISLLQLLVGATLAFVGMVAILRLSNLWTVTDVRYAEYSAVLFWGLILVAGALRHR